LFLLLKLRGGGEAEAFFSFSVGREKVRDAITERLGCRRKGRVDCFVA
jgi:hypothetical protein